MVMLLQFTGQSTDDILLISKKINFGVIIMSFQNAPILFTACFLIVVILGILRSYMIYKERCIIENRIMLRSIKILIGGVNKCQENYTELV